MEGNPMEKLNPAELDGSDEVPQDSTGEGTTPTEDTERDGSGNSSKFWSWLSDMRPPKE